MDKLLEILLKMAPLSESLQKYLKLIMVPYEFSRGEFIEHAGTIHERAYFIVKGIIRCYTRRNRSDEDKELEINKWFKCEGDMITSIESFQQQIPSEEYIQALKPSIVLSTTFAELGKLYEAFPEFYKHSHVIATRERQFQGHVSDMLRLPGKERYLFILQRYPELLKHIPQKYLATFMGLEETTVSRIKSQKRL